MNHQTSSGMTKFARRTFAGVALAVAAAAFTAPVNAQTASKPKPVATATAPKPFSKAECAGIAQSFIVAVKAIDGTSAEFRDSMIAWINAPAYSCNGPTEIAVVNESDVDAFRSLRRGLNGVFKSKDDVLMDRAGLRGVEPKPSTTGKPTASLVGGPGG